MATFNVDRDSGTGTPEPPLDSADYSAQLLEEDIFGCALTDIEIVPSFATAPLGNVPVPCSESRIYRSNPPASPQVDLFQSEALMSHFQDVKYSLGHIDTHWRPSLGSEAMSVDCGASGHSQHVDFAAHFSSHAAGTQYPTGNPFVTEVTGYPEATSEQIFESGVSHFNLDPIVGLPSMHPYEACGVPFPDTHRYDQQMLPVQNVQSSCKTSRFPVSHSIDTNGNDIATDQQVGSLQQSNAVWLQSCLPRQTKPPTGVPSHAPAAWRAIYPIFRQLKMTQTTHSAGTRPVELRWCCTYPQAVMILHLVHNFETT